ncbi:putative movement protein [Ourmia melon virus]|uniref:Putative movement protein n=1 Tax=Ourmia melon virus (isolate Melon/Iran/VE9) TaxID=652838 RepID=MVP_OUMVV|nr:putative movement protein [Ourmia melon virus]B3VML2.1 RecName: Full=Putative movement protein; AltName: Full=Cell-to-cell transport protein [Ourmia melon virus VE9]ACF16361.1 putative movement protein [Ourmia melon virus]
MGDNALDLATASSTPIPMPNTGQLVISPQDIGYSDPPKLRGRLKLEFVHDISLDANVEDPIALIPHGIWSIFKSKLAQMRCPKGYITYDKVILSWKPHVATGLARGQIAVVDTRVNHTSIEDLMHKALWKTAPVDLGCTYTIQGTVPYCLPFHPKEGGDVKSDLESQNPIRGIVYITDSRYQEAARHGALTMTLKLSIGTMPTDALTGPRATLSQPHLRDNLRSRSQRISRPPIGITQRPRRSLAEPPLEKEEEQESTLSSEASGSEQGLIIPVQGPSTSSRSRRVRG